MVAQPFVSVITGPVDNSHLVNRMVLLPLPTTLTKFHVANFLLASLAPRCSEVTLDHAELLSCPTVPNANMFVFYPRGIWFTAVTREDLDQIRARLTDAVRTEFGGFFAAATIPAAVLGHPSSLGCSFGV